MNFALDTYTLVCYNRQMSCAAVVVKRFVFKGKTEEWSNRYVFDGTAPADDAAWLTFLTALATAEKTLYMDTHFITRMYGYNDPSPAGTASYVRDLVPSAGEIQGTLTLGTGLVTPGDTAGWIRWKTNHVTSPQGRPIYLRKYYHGVPSNASTTPNTPLTAWTTNATAFAAKMWDGTLSGGRKLTGYPVHTVVGASVGPWLTTRTLKRRGKRTPG